MISLELYRARIGKHHNVKSVCLSPHSGTMQPMCTLLPPSPLSNVKLPRSILIVILLATLAIVKVDTTTSIPVRQSQSMATKSSLPPTFLATDHPLHLSGPITSKTSRPTLILLRPPSHLQIHLHLKYVHLPQVTSPQLNKKAHCTNGNGGVRGRKPTVMYWNKGSSYLVNKMDDIRTLVEQHKPMLFGLGEARPRHK